METKINLSVTRTGSTTKPIKGDFSSMYFDNKTLTINDMCDYIKNGHTFGAVYNAPSFSISGRNKDNYLYGNIIPVDIDYCDCDMNDYLETLTVKPTIAYTTYSNGVEGKGYRFRFLWCFEDAILPYCYTPLHGKVCDMNNINGEENDKHQSNISQLFIGNGSGKCEMVVNEQCTYHVNDFVSSCDLEKCFNTNTNITHTYTISNRVETKNTFTDELFAEAWNTMNDTFILTNYTHYYTEESTYVPMTQGQLITDLTDKDIYTIKRKWAMSQYIINGKNIPYRVRLKNGEHRRKMIFLSLVKRRLINPSITLEHLAYSALYELYHYIDNTDESDKITRFDLYVCANDALNTDLATYKDKMKDKTTFRVNKTEAMKQGITPRQASAMENSRRNRIKRQEKYNEMAKWYDPSKKDKENLEIFKEHELDVKRTTLYRFKKEYKQNYAIAY